MGSTTQRSEVESCEQALLSAVAEADRDAVAALLHDDFAVSSAVWNLVKLDRDTWLDLASQTRTESLAATLLDLVELSDSVIVSLRWDWRASHNGDDSSDALFLTHVWQRTDDGWLLRWRSKGGCSMIREELDGSS
jgi:ketosteroid isomerase-like protein